MRLLVLGGTSWLGGAVAEAALNSDHEVTCLARGVSGGVPTGAELVAADRWTTDAYAGLDGRRWDAAVEVSWQPALVRDAVSVLRDRVDHWVYVSSISVYDSSVPGAGDEEDTTLEPLPDSGTAEVSGEVYGEAKVTCERELRDLLDDARLLVARAGLIVGYGDRSDRFGYWPGRFAAGTGRPDVLVPPMATPVQGIDVADLAPWLVAVARARVAGTLDVVGPRHTLADVVHASQRLARGAAFRTHEVDEDRLTEAGVRPWAGPDSLPLWLPRDAWGMASRHGDRARAAGLTHSALADTAARALRWEVEQGLDRPRRAGLTPEREAELIGRLRHHH